MQTRALAPFGVEIFGFQISSAGANVYGSAMSVGVSASSSSSEAPATSDGASASSESASRLSGGGSTTLSTEPRTSIAEVIELIARHRVAVFREQDADDAAFVAFLRMLGDLTFTEGETPVAGWPDLNVVSNVGRTTPPRSVFHTDTSYVERPPAFTALRPVRLPGAGGTTLFSDQVRAADRLPRRVRETLMGRTVLHGISGIEGGAGATRHPLFRRHPVTNEVALFLSTPERCCDLSGVDDKMSSRAIAALYRHSTRESNLYRHTWQAGDVVVWDDRLTMHRADHDGVSGDRVLHRGMVLGEIPIPA